MNNYYGYIYKNPFEKVHIPPPIEEPSGLWNSKKNRQRIEKEANLLHNRVNLLHQEEYKIGKKILETKKKMHEFIEKKRRDYQELYQVLYFLFYLPIFFEIIERKKKS